MAIRHWIKRALFAPLRIPAVRDRVLFWARQEHYPEAEFEVPLSHGLVCPIYSPEYWCSFSEIFVNGEYAPVFEQIPLPDRWVDIGCHAGFFSLYTAWRRIRAGLPASFECLLIDADARVQRSAERIKARNKLPSFQFSRGAVGAGAGTIQFAERGFMASSAESCDAGAGISRSVPVQTPELMAALLPPPYDLIKVDVEGSEFEFLTHYGRVISQTEFLLLEWHSWHRGGGGETQLTELARGLGFSFEGQIQEAHDVGKGRQCGVLLFRNSKAGGRRKSKPSAAVIA